MHVGTALFVIMLVVAHAGDPAAVDRPLSLFRDERPAVGYGLFGLLILVGWQHLRSYYRLGRGRELVVPTISLILLTFVALTGSPETGHSLAAFSLLGLVFLWYAARLYRVGSLWLFAHLAAPVLLLSLTSARSYGLWQKGFILYFLLVVNLDCLLATGRLYLPGPDDFARKRSRRQKTKYVPRVIWRRNDSPPNARRA